MSYKSILVLAFGKADGPAIEAGAWLAMEHGAVTRVLPVYPDVAAELAATAAAFGGGVPPGAFQAASEIGEACQARIESACFSASAATDVEQGPGEGAPRLILLPYDRAVWSAIERACVLADLVVFSGQLLDLERERSFQLIEEVLMRQRRPLLVVRGKPEDLAGPAVVAWNGRGEAGRAVAAALPLLGGASAILAVHHPDAAADGGASIAALSDYLKLHDVGACETRQLSGPDADQAILAACHETGAGLLVAGAYGHSRIREFVLGGVTRSLLGAGDGPSLLLSH